jgi:hypothetical protein
MTSSAAPPQLSYWHVWTDAEGVSRQSRCVMDEFRLSSISAPASPQWLGNKFRSETTVMVTVLPSGWVGSWHENPKPQWIIPLSGKWFVESMDGQRTEMGPGEISFGADQHTIEKHGRKGHLSGTVGDAPAVLLLIQIEDDSARFQPCAFR